MKYFIKIKSIFTKKFKTQKLMKKLVLTIVLGLLFVSFSNAQSTETVAEEVKTAVASNDVVYQCPMDCEKGKTYKEAASCPVCKMDLKAKEGKKSCCKGKDKAESKGKKKAECKSKKEGKSCCKGKDKAEEKK